MKLFLYKLIFPDCNQFYVGIASDESRYCSPVNSKFTQRSHHNKKVQKLLRDGEFCFWRVIKEFETWEQLIEAETAYLRKVWSSGDYRSRPSFLLNSVNESFGRASGWNHTEETKQKIGKSPTQQTRRRPEFFRLEVRERKTGFNFKEIWDEVEAALNATTSYHWGGAKIARKFNISRRTLAKMSNAIRNNITFHEWTNSC